MMVSKYAPVTYQDKEFYIWESERWENWIAKGFLAIYGSEKDIGSLEQKFNVLHTEAPFLLNTLIGVVVQDPHLLIEVPRNYLYGQFFPTISSEVCGPGECER